MKIKSAGAVMALPPLRSVNVKKGEVVEVFGMVSSNGKPAMLCISRRLNATLLVKRERLVL